jgi:hypothetical protein
VVPSSNNTGDRGGVPAPWFGGARNDDSREAIFGMSATPVVLRRPGSHPRDIQTLAGTLVDASCLETSQKNQLDLEEFGSA